MRNPTRAPRAIEAPFDPRSAARFFAKVAPGDRGYDGSECWTWTASQHRGYGQFFHAGRVVRAHRWAFAYFREAVPDGLSVDHLCENTICVNPWHMDLVPVVVNAARQARVVVGGRCPWGHALPAENVYVGPSGYRTCRTCLRASQIRSRAKSKAQAAA